MSNKKLQRRDRIKNSIRTKVSGTADKPRLSVFRSNTSLYLQIIDDKKGVTLVSASSKEVGAVKNVNTETAKKTGLLLAEKAKSVGVSSVVFDRNGYLYHGKVKAVADGAREGGLIF